ncbi:DUF5753 domain-containing protein [Plantactinospora solaniradicis]|uniref:DUF5753 domain-containing protein n=1 Tax=Plantactinospora solaniradicis TaxID=1723736 RepID=A0ABW1KPF8_9ACTN
MSATEITAICGTLNIPTDQQNHLVRLSRSTGRIEWWDRYPGEIIPPRACTYLGLEDKATRLCVFDPDHIPDLTRTRRYATAFLRRNPDLTEPVCSEQVVVLLRRQQILSRATPPDLDVVIQEKALSWQVGTRDDMRVQLRHLVNLTRIPHISIRVLPRAASPAANHATVFALPDPEPDVVYRKVDDRTSYELLSDVSGPDRVWDQVDAEALGVAASRELIIEAAGLW